MEDLTQWLSVVEMGLSGMLEPVGEDTIEEEQEDSTNTDIRTEASRGALTLKSDNLLNGLALAARS